jgi:hypothetical protein
MDSIEQTSFNIVSKNGTAITSALMQIWERFGRPEDFTTQTGKVLLNEIINVWKYFFKHEYEAVLHDNAIDLKNEKPLSEMKHGYSPISYPTTLYKLIKALFPYVNMSSRKTQRTIQSIAPFLKVTNARI